MGHLLNQANVDGGGESWVERFHNYVDRYLEILRYFEASMNNSAICNGEKMCVMLQNKNQCTFCYCLLSLPAISLSLPPWPQQVIDEANLSSYVIF